MRPHNLIFAPLLVLIFMMPVSIYSQTETFDMVTYTPPKGWTRTAKNDSVSFGDLNKTANAFCAMTVYIGTASSGDPKKDFAVDWKVYVAKPYNADENPKTEIRTGEGWTITVASAPIEISGIKSLALLTVFSGYGKTSGILVFSNNEAYTQAVSDFLESVKLDKTPLALQPTPNTPNTPVANSNNPALVGKWGNGISGIGGTTQQHYQFNADGTYSFVLSGYSGLAGRIGTYQTTTEESGVYTLNGDSMTITPKKSQTKSNSEGLKNNPLEIVTYRWTIHYFEGVKEYALIMHPDHKTKRDGEFSYGYAAFPNSYGYSPIK